MKRSIDIPDEMYAKLSVIAKELGITISAVIKMACSEYIRKMGDK
jgi:predicted DNA-binding protein